MGSATTIAYSYSGFNVSVVEANQYSNLEDISLQELDFTMGPYLVNVRRFNVKPCEFCEGIGPSKRSKLAIYKSGNSLFPICDFSSPTYKHNIICALTTLQNQRLQQTQSVLKKFALSIHNGEVYADCP